MMFRRRILSSILLLLPIITIIISITNVSASSNSNPTLDEPFQTSFLHLPQLPCVSLFTRTNRIGCGTYTRDDMKGTLLHWPTLANSLINDDDGGSSQSYYLPPFIATLYDYEYTSDTVDQIVTIGKNENTAALRGILVLNSNSDDLQYNPVSATPRGYNTPSASLNPSYQYQWNPNGDGLMNRDMYGIPTGYVHEDDVGSYLLQISTEKSAELLRSGLSSKNDATLEDPGIVGNMNLYMGPSEMTTSECLTWKDEDDGAWRPKCLPLGGNSVWALAGSPYEPSSSDNNNNDDGNDNNDRRMEDDDGKKSIVMLATNLDSTSMFHESVPGANSAASNILSLLMAAKLIGAYVDDATLDGLDKKIMFGFFQGESYGFMGSRLFLKDVLGGFECGEGLTVPSSTKQSNNAGEDDGSNNNLKMGCLNPLREDLAFSELGNIHSMIAVDQIGVLSAENNFYVHATGGGYYADLSDIVTGMSSDDWTISEGSAGAIPPTPLSSLYQISGGAIGGIVLAGYDDTFSDEYYMTHLDSNATRPVDMDSIAMAGTILARTALAAAYDDGDANDDAVLNYAENTIPQLESDDEALLELANCLFTDGNCDLFLKYGKMERTNTNTDTGTDLGMGTSLGTPPNYYTSVYDASNGQAFAQVSGGRYGAYTGDKYGEKDNDAILVRPSLLETSVHGLLDEYLGGGSSGDDDTVEPEPKSCSSSDDCTDVSYCSTSTADRAICSGGEKVCVCSRAHYHSALDESILPSPDNRTGTFVVSDDDEGISAMYSEPYWSNDIGVEVYYEAGDVSGRWAFGAGFVSAVGWVVSTLFLKRRLVKEKLY